MKIIIALVIIFGLYSSVQTIEALQDADYLGVLLWPIFGMLPAAVILTIFIARAKQKV